jgi:hypothetical protein
MSDSEEERAKAGVMKVLDDSGLSRQGKIDVLEKMLHGPAKALNRVNAMQDKIAARAKDIDRALHSADPKQRALARDIKILSTRVENLEAQKRANVLNLFREYDIKGDSSSPREIETLMMLMANLKATEDRLGKENIAITFLEGIHEGDVIGRFLGWAGEWKKCAFARLSVGAKLGAALMLTDAPDEVVAPWATWSLCVPDGIITYFSPDDKGVRYAFSIMRLWCYGTEPVAAIANVSRPEIGDKSDVCYLNAFDGPEKPWMQLARNFVKGACLSLAIDVETHRNKLWGGPKGSKRAPGVVPDAGVDYVLSGTVEIDLRDEVRRICEGRKVTGGHGGLTVQFLVRGHWRNQAVGVRHSDRKRIWIEPFWKGPEEARVLLRTHRIKTEDGES